MGNWFSRIPTARNEQQRIPSAPQKEEQITPFDLWKQSKKDVDDLLRLLESN